MRIWISKDKSRTQSYCLACRYEREDVLRAKKGLPPRSRYFSPACRRGHLKTPANWRYHKAIGSHYCHRCHMDGRIEKRRQKREAEAA